MLMMLNLMSITERIEHLNSQLKYKEQTLQLKEKEQKELRTA
jgi:hypothetical protein